MSPPPTPTPDHHSPLSRAVRATSLMTLASRFGGLARDILVGRIFGATLTGSAFAAAFAIPNMFRRLFGEGALSAAFIPEYTKAHAADPAEANKLASLTVCALGLVTGALTLIIELALLLILLLAPHDPERALSLRLIMVMLPFMPFICIVAILAGMLQVHGKFAAAASGPLILNTFIIAVGLWSLLSGSLAGETTAYILGIATVLSGITQMLWFFRLLSPHVSWTRAWSSVRPRAANMLRKFVPVAIGLGTLQLNTLLDTLIAMWPTWVGPTMFGRPYPLDQSSNAILSLTARLYQFPLGVFGIAVASAAFPLLARHADNHAHFTDTLRRGLRLSLFIGLPATIGLVLIRNDAVAVLFGGGRTGWSAAHLDRAAAVLMGFSIAIWAYSLNQVFTRAFYAKQDTRTPMLVSIAMMLLNIALNLTLIWIPGVRESGLAWATAVSAVIQSFVLWFLCERMLRATLPAPSPNEPAPPRSATRIFDPAMIRAAVKVAAASAVMGLLVYLLLTTLPTTSPLAAHTQLPHWLTGQWPWWLARTLSGTFIGALAYLALSRALSIPELHWLTHRSSRPETSSRPE